MQRSEKITESQKSLVFAKIDYHPKSREEIKTELQDAGITQSQIYNQLRVLYNNKKILKQKTLMDGRRISYYLNEVNLS